jgi:broad specificity phosphatase PhoE
MPDSYLYLLRHGETPFTKENRYTGSNDPGILEEEKEKIRRVSIHFLTSKPPHKIYTSPMRRAKETATVVHLLFPDATLTEDTRLREIHYGNWEGKTREEILKEDPNAFLLWDEDPFSTSPPGGEKVEGVWERAIAFFQEKIVPEKEKNILIVSHRTVLRLLFCYLLKIPPQEYRRRVDFLPGHLTLFFRTPHETFLLLHHNLPPL